jgi:isopentenyl-diphosphate delta-isomerase type 1
VTATTASEDTVVLLGHDRQPIGEMLRTRVHSESTPLHLAFSLYLFNPSGEVLITRRALGKATWPGVWTNSCCGHPRPGESLQDAVHRRLWHELGIDVTDLRCVLPDFAYEARDAGGLQENEVCPVFTGSLLHPDGPVEPNPDEVMDWAWVAWADVALSVPRLPVAFSPWAVEQVRQLSPLL